MKSNPGSFKMSAAFFPRRLPESLRTSEFLESASNSEERSREEIEVTEIDISRLLGPTGASEFLDKEFTSKCPKLPLGEAGGDVLTFLTCRNKPKFKVLDLVANSYVISWPSLTLICFLWWDRGWILYSCMQVDVGGD
jgi:hypothetical protein